MANLEALISSSAEEGMHGVQAFFTATAEDASGPALPFLLSPQRSELVIHTRTSNFSASDHIREESARGRSLHSEQVVGLYPLESLPLRQQQQQQEDQQQQWQQHVAANGNGSSNNSNINGNSSTAAAAITTTAATTSSTEATATAA